MASHCVSRPFGNVAHRFSRWRWDGFFVYAFYLHHISHGGGMDWRRIHSANSYRILENAQLALVDNLYCCHWSGTFMVARRYLSRSPKNKNISFAQSADEMFFSFKLFVKWRVSFAYHQVNQNQTAAVERCADV